MKRYLMLMVLFFGCSTAQPLCEYCGYGGGCMDFSVGAAECTVCGKYHYFCGREKSLAKTTDGNNYTLSKCPKRLNPKNGGGE